VSDATATPVRICLSGEDLDWIGGRCCCVAVGLETSVDLHPMCPGSRHDSEYLDVVWAALLQRFHIASQPPPCLSVATSAPIGGGFSTSTSLVIALIRACLAYLGKPPLPPLELARFAYDVEHGFSGGGGMDQLSIVLGGALLMEGRARGLPPVLDHVAWPADFGLLLIDPSLPKSTPRHLAAVRTQLARSDPNLERYRVIATGCTDRAWRGLVDRDLAFLASAVNDAHAAMRDHQCMSTPEMERVRDVALGTGCAAVKLTGGGGGGCLFAVTRGDDNVKADLDAAYSASRLTVETTAVSAVAPGWYRTAALPAGTASF